MRIVVGADHRGYELKDEIAAALKQAGHEVLDLGTHSADSVDYPDYARAIGGALTDGRAERGILVGGRGGGARLMTTLLHELERTGGRYGMQLMCCGGGLGTATIIERLD